MTLLAVPVAGTLLAWHDEVDAPHSYSNTILHYDVARTYMTHRKEPRILIVGKVTGLVRKAESKEASVRKHRTLRKLFRNLGN